MECPNCGGDMEFAGRSIALSGQFNDAEDGEDLITHRSDFRRYVCEGCGYEERAEDRESDEDDVYPVDGDE